MSARHAAVLLPGGVLPAAPAYAPLLEMLGERVDAVVKDLEVYADDEPPLGFGLDTEVVGIARAADAHGFDRFHLVGYSGGGAASLAFAARHGGRLLSLALLEPAWAGNERTSEEDALMVRFRALESLPPEQFMAGFTRLQLAPGVEPPPPPDGPPPPWLAKRPAGLRAFIRAFESGDLDRIAPDAMKVRLALDNNAVYPLPGKLLFSDARVDAHTGQVTLRGEFPNPKRELLPGMYVRVQIEQGIDTDAIAVPQQAIQRNVGGGSEVFVVRDDNHVAVQSVRTGSLQDGQWFVSEGLKAGDKVVVEGFQKFAAGDKVKPQAWAEADASALPDAKQTAQVQR